MPLPDARPPAEPGSYAEAVEQRRVTEWLVAKEAAPMPEPERLVWTRAVQLNLWPEMECAA